MKTLVAFVLLALMLAVPAQAQEVEAISGPASQTVTISSSVPGSCSLLVNEGGGSLVQVDSVSCSATSPYPGDMVVKWTPEPSQGYKGYGKLTIHWLLRLNATVSGQ